MDAPLAEEVEQYQLTVVPDIGPERMQMLQSAGFTYSAADRALDRAAGAASVRFEVRQAGRFGLSPPTFLIFPVDTGG